MSRYVVKKQVYKLPPGYKRLEYIRATGTQYINTGVKLASTDYVMAKFKNKTGEIIDIEIKKN